MDIIQTKLLVAFLFGVIRFISGILPMHIFHCLKIEKEVNGRKIIDEERKKALDFAVVLVQSFGGGVLFATCFLHMMPEVYYSVEELKNYGVLKRNYPYSQLIISTGFFTVYFVEEIGQWIVTLVPKEPWVKPSCRSSSSTMRIISQDNKVKPTEIINAENNISMHVEKDEKNTKDFEDEFSVDLPVDEEVQTENERNQDLETDLEKEQELQELMEKKVVTQQQLLRGIFIILALSFHAVLEGLAIGLQHSVTNIWYLFTAVSVHSATILFCIGLEIYLSGSKRRIMVITIILSLGSPIGVLIGLIVSLTTDMHTQAKSLAVVHLEGLSAGTILYITFFEVLSREKERRMCRVKRAIFIIGGFVMMAALELLKVD